MLTFGRYVHGVLAQIKSSYDVFEGLEDEPGSLDVLRREWLKASALLSSLARRIESSEKTGDVYLDLARRCRYYTENYYFDKEIDTMSGLYSGDSHRIKNIRLKILDSFADRKLIEHICRTMEKLDG